MRRGLTFKQVCKKYEGDCVNIHPRTIRFARAKKYYWQVQYVGGNGKPVYVPREHARA